MFVLQTAAPGLNVETPSSPRISGGGMETTKKLRQFYVAEGLCLLQLGHSMLPRAQTYRLAC
jgi:hypothetical protein